jgi:hypothetical protein
VSTATATRPTKRTTSTSTTRRASTAGSTTRRQPATATRARTEGEPPAPKTARDRSTPHGVEAAKLAERRGSRHLRLPVVGDVGLPSTSEVAFLGGVVVLAAVGLVEWPVAILLGVGHQLATNAHFKSLREFGQALEEV